MTPLTSAVLLGFVLGLQHATDPDHLVAVATIVTRERRFRAGALVGTLWGLGHTLTLGVVGGALVVLGLAVPPAFGTGLELIVAAMLVLLGVLRLRDAVGLRNVAPDHLTSAHVADHDHDGSEVLHSHPHSHGHDTHAHTHVHPSRGLLSALEGRGLAWRAVLVGAVHGLAGSAAVSLLVMATLRTPTGALLYLLVFGAGTIAGMTMLTAVMAWPVAWAARLAPARRVLAVGAGAGSLAFGILYAVRIVA
ncbi:MAG: high-affinity nickel-transport family protein [Candidatus Rokubacteria bacterium]|nr:high-affinity nickel-transport family protein [Candidatus Rokubacteria bacterium]